MDFKGITGWVDGFFVQDGAGAGPSFDALPGSRGRPSGCWAERPRQLLPAGRCPVTGPVNAGSGFLYRWSQRDAMFEFLAPVRRQCGHGWGRGRGRSGGASAGTAQATGDAVGLLGSRGPVYSFRGPPGIQTSPFRIKENGVLIKQCKILPSCPLWGWL